MKLRITREDCLTLVRRLLGEDAKKKPGSRRFLTREDGTPFDESALRAFVAVLAEHGVHFLSAEERAHEERSSGKDEPA
jgi:hypothetical protein